MIFKRKKKHKKHQMKHIPLPILIRQTIYDTMLEPAEGIANALGLPPISEEVSDMESQASQKRLERFAGLFPFIDSHSDMVARISAAAYSMEDKEAEVEALHLDSESLDRISSLFKLVALASSISCISTLFSLDLIESKVAQDE